MADILKLGGSAFHPSAANTGNEQATVLRGRNMLMRGSNGSHYFECYGGHKNLNEQLPLLGMDGTISYTNGSLEVEGSGTAFKEHLRFGQKIFTGDPLQVLVVDRVISDTELIIQRAPDATATGQEWALPPHLFESRNQRGTMNWGNALKFDRGNILAVGQGQLRFNGQPLPGEPLWATRRLQIALWNPTTQDYDVGQMGFDVAPPNNILVVAVAGGTRNMSIGRRSFRFAWANSKTGYGFSNPSEVIKLDAFNNPLAITATNQRFQFDFTAALPSRPTNADAIIIYQSLFSDPAQSDTQAAEGSWYVAKTVLVADLEAGDITYVDVLDGELGTEVTFDNDVPPNADWLSALAGDPIMIGCYGDTVVGGDERGDSPGPFVSISRRGNRDGYPAALATPLSPPDEIIGFLPAAGRLFLMTRVGLPFAASTGQADFPVETRAFWSTGFKSPYGLVFVNNDLYAFTFRGPTRSIATGDQGSEQFAFAAAVEETTKEWVAGYVHTVHDPKNEYIVFIYSAAYRNDDGWWVSLALPFSLRHNAWMPLIELSKPGRDMVVTGAAMVGGNLQFLAGGRGETEVPPDSGSESEEEEDFLLLNGAADHMACTGACGWPEGETLGVHSQRTGDVTVSTSVLRPGGSHSIRMASDSLISAIWAPYNLTVDGEIRTGYSVRFYIRFEDSLPTTDAVIWMNDNTATFFGTSRGLGFDVESGTLRCFVAGSVTLTLVFNDTGSDPIVANTWYRVDLRVRHALGITELECNIDDDPIEGLSYSDAWAGNSMGAMYMRNGAMHFADYIVTTDYDAFPIGPGHVRRWVPNADGAHNITTLGDFKRGSTATAIADSDTDTFGLINDYPMPGNNTAVTGDDYIRQHLDTALGADQYVEHTFSNPDGYTPDLPPRLVQYLAAYHKGFSGTSNGSLILVDGPSAVEMADMLIATVAYATRYRGLAVAPVLETPWTLAGGEGNFLNLKSRFGYMTAAQAISLDAVMFEVEFPGDS